MHLDQQMDFQKQNHIQRSLLNIQVKMIQKEIQISDISEIIIQIQYKMALKNIKTFLRN
ncbi:unnamed protein product [Paramecium pentaurelia]|uniref:Uncharacterized protein n=1 Tax=Paramecium pentaurelia TaxID=43138 RepID=A0A8S1WXV0_9CILI|nr:unnamed protein product [Paramecium pentaurelia]